VTAVALLTHLLALAAGGLLVWLASRQGAAETVRLREERTRALTEIARLQTTIEKERQAAAEKMRLLDQARAQLSDAFKALSAEALQNNNASFVHLAQATFEKLQEAARGDLDRRQQAIGDLVLPLKESLHKVDEKIREMEATRAVAYSTLSEHLKTLTTAQGSLERETAKLVGALRSSSTRGRWGEIQLQRVVEMAGMTAHCDFSVQASVSTEDGRLRPDLVVRLPNRKNVVIDAKAPLDAFLDSLEALDEEGRRAKLRDHARQIRSHLSRLTAKG